ncbi:MAG: helix-turn-helix domain-containing protein [Umezawaea sp.]
MDELIRDPKTLRALAHPLRWKLIDLLGSEEQCTATRCAQVLGESVASCSYHLNVLAKYGFVAEVAGPGRQKPWKLTRLDQSWSGEDADGELALAGEAATEAFLEAEFAKTRDRMRLRSLESDEWRPNIRMSGYTQYLTAEEAGEVLAEIDAIFARTAERMRNPETRPEGSRPVRFFHSTSVPPKND